MNRFSRPLAAALLLAFATPVAAGPPYVTDDPEPTELGHWEIYNFANFEGAHRDWDGEIGVDLNYGAVKDVQLTATLPLALTHEGGPGGAGTQVGAGDVELGLKYRFVHSESAGVQMAIFPRVILPTGGKKFGTGRASFLLPVWAQKDLGPWSIFGGGGYTINPGTGNKDFWQAGLAVTRDVSKRLSLGGEATWQGADAVGGHATTGLGIGGIYKLGGPFSLLVSGGPTWEHHGPTGWRGYAALGLNF